jgi:hypothetical protein
MNPVWVCARNKHRGAPALIHLSDYTSSILKFVKSRQMAFVYIFATEGKPPCKIGYGLNLKNRLEQLQAAQPRRLTIEYIAWCPNAPTAALIAEGLRHRLVEFEVRAGWYLKIPEAIAEVRKACSMFPSFGIIEHGVLMQRLGAVR